MKRRHGLDAVKMILITNASMFHRPAVERGLAILDQNQGEIWAKLEAGTDAYYQLVERTTIPLRRILDNITAAARMRPLVIQSLFMRIDDVPPTADRAGRLLRPAERDHGRRRKTVAGANLHRRPPSGGIERHAVIRCRSRRDSRIASKWDEPAVHGY